MKVLLIYVNTAARAAFPIGLSSIANYMAFKGHTVEVFDTTFYKEFYAKKRDHFREKVGFYNPIKNPVQIQYSENPMIDSFINQVAEFQPDIVGFSIITTHTPIALKMSNALKEHFPQVPVIFGGTHPTLFPKEMIAELSVDMVCLGEGEYSFSQLLAKMDKKEDITKIKGIWVKQDGKIYENPIGDLANLDELPPTNWDFFSNQHLFAPLDGKMYRVGPVEFSRGCPYSCAYCSINILRNMVGTRKYLRTKAIETVIKDLVQLRDKYKIEMFYFLDETFLSIPMDTLKRFAEAYIKEVHTPWYGLTHPSSVNEEKAKILKDMGCYLMTMGIESGNEEFRKKILNRPVSNEKVIEAFRLLRENGVHASAFGMVGLPFETREMIFDTIELFRACQPKTYAVGIFKPFLGSPIRDITIKAGFFDPKSWDDESFPDTESVLNMPQITKEEIAGLYKTFYLYTKLPKDKWPLVKQAERDDDLLAALVKEYKLEKDSRSKAMEEEAFLTLAK